MLTRFPPLFWKAPSTSATAATAATAAAAATADMKRDFDVRAHTADAGFAARCPRWRIRVKVIAPALDTQIHLGIPLPLVQKDYVTFASACDVCGVVRGELI